MIATPINPPTAIFSPASARSWPIWGNSAGPGAGIEVPGAETCRYWSGKAEAAIEGQDLAGHVVGLDE